MRQRRDPRVLKLSEYRRRQRMQSLKLGGLAFAGVFGLGMLVVVLAPRTPDALQTITTAGATQSFPCTVASITDGDTLRCAERGPDGRDIRLRLSGIAARERDGSCTAGHPCPAASAEASTAALERLAWGKTLSCLPVGSTYGRVAAFCRVDAVDLSCAMVQGGYAAKWQRYWGDHRC